MSRPNGISIRFTLLSLALGLLAVAVPLFFVINNWGPRTDEHRFLFDMDAFVLKWDADDDNALNVEELRRLSGHRRLDYIAGLLFRVADKNRDGKLDRRELNTAAGQDLAWLLGARRSP
jgi:EF hand domain-containing protein